MCKCQGDGGSAVGRVWCQGSCAQGDINPRLINLVAPHPRQMLGLPGRCRRAQLSGILNGHEFSRPRWSGFAGPCFPANQSLYVSVHHTPDSPGGYCHSSSAVGEGVQQLTAVGPHPRHRSERHCPAVDASQRRPGRWLCVLTSGMALKEREKEQCGGSERALRAARS